MKVITDDAELHEEWLLYHIAIYMLGGRKLRNQSDDCI